MSRFDNPKHGLAGGLDQEVEVGLSQLSAHGHWQFTCAAINATEDQVNAGAGRCAIWVVPVSGTVYEPLEDEAGNALTVDMAAPRSRTILYHPVSKVKAVPTGVTAANGATDIRLTVYEVAAE